jgi:hypothetical protein
VNETAEWPWLSYATLIAGDMEGNVRWGAQALISIEVPVLIAILTALMLPTQ